MKKDTMARRINQGRPALVVAVVALQTFVLAQFVEDGNNAQDSKSEDTQNAKCQCPTLTVVDAFNEHHKTKNGKEYGSSKKWKFHDRNDLLQK